MRAVTLGEQYNGAVLEEVAEVAVPAFTSRVSMRTVRFTSK